MYTCKGCGKPIGLMADMKGVPTLYKCPKNNSVQEPQEIVRRELPKKRKLRKTKGVETERVSE